MLTLPGYRIKETLHSTVRSVIYRGEQEKGQMPVILKALNKAYPTPLEQAHFQHEYTLTRQLGGAGIIQALDLFHHQHRPVIVLEDIGGITLKQVQSEQCLSLADKISIALQITRALARVHEREVMHKDINPTNIIFNPRTGQLKLIDFGLATVLSREQPEVRHPEHLEGTLAYLSPEQSGRMNRALDYRTDFYSLGVTLYELLTGRLPFESNDPLELLHAHMALTPPPPHSLDPSIPLPLSEIVLKLLAKTAEARYQSCYGLQADLEAVQRQWQSSGQVEPFPLGQHDLSPRFQLPQRLYGREAEISILLSAFERVSEGATELLLVTGYAGVGKSALINELHKPITRQRGYFIAGKFDQFQRNVPYSALIQAFRALMHQLLTESEARVAAWREKLREALGPNGQIIIEVIPEVELLIGPQPPVPELGPTENQNRFQFVFQNFIGVFAQEAHPLVLFLDDLQWADAASLRLLRLFLTDPERRHLLVLGAYRDNEVDELHPLHKLRQALTEAHVQVTELALTPLDVEDVTHFVADTVHHGAEPVRPLAEVLFAKTQGNPFFLGEFLKTLYHEGLLSFVANRGEGGVGWQWNLTEVEARNITDNVVELMRGKLLQLPEATKQALQVAACLGNRFSLMTLVQVQEQNPVQMAATLWPALEQGLLVPQGEDYRLLQNEGQGYSHELMTTLKVTYQFPHDRVQQAAYELIPEHERAPLHLGIGRLLLASQEDDTLDEHLFEIVDHLNAGRALLTEPDEREQLARLNLRAGEKAKSAAAYEPAAQYLQVGLALLPPRHWQSHYDLALALHEAAAETAFLRGEFTELDEIVERAVQQARTALHRVSFYYLQFQAYVAQQKLLEALEHGRAAIAELGLVTLPARPTLLHLIVIFLQTKLRLGRRRPETLIHLPPMQNPLALATGRMLMSVIGAAYISGSKLLVLIAAFHGVQLSLKYGNSALSTIAYVFYGAILCAQDDIETGYLFGQLARELIERAGFKESRGATEFGINYNIQHWKRHLRESDFMAVYQHSLEGGDLLTAGFGAANTTTMQPFELGYPLPQVAGQMGRFRPFLERIQQLQSTGTLDLYRQVICNLQGEGIAPTSLDGEHFNATENLARFAESRNFYLLCLTHHYKTLLSYHFGEYEQAVAHAREATRYLDGITASYHVPGVYLYHSLALLAHYPSAPRAEQKRYLKQVAANQKKMKRWAKHGPMNYAHKYELVEAERARLREDHAAAINHYQQTIDLARKHGYLQEEALANELAGRYYLGRGMSQVAQSYLRDARQDYLTWGAQAKVQWLEQQYPNLLMQPTEPEGVPFVSHTLTTSRDSTGAGQQLDLATVVKASQAISSEINLDRLLEQLLRIVMENAGAEKGALLLVEEGELRVEAEGTIAPPKVRLLQARPLEESEALSAAVVHYIERTQQDLVLDDATQAELFRHDAYIRRQRPRSILATPLLNQSQLIGVLYLENNLTTGAFTPARVEMVRLLGTQAAISITNAQAIAARADQERLQLEKHLLEQRAQDLAELNASKDKFFSIISHDLRSPFNGLLGLSQLMLKYAPSLTPDEVENYAGRVYDSGNQVLALLDTLLEWSQVQTGRMPFAPDEVNLHAVARRNLALLADVAEGKQIRLLSEVDDPLMVYVDLHMLDTVTRNLLSNALKFTPSGGQVTLSATPRDGVIEVSVSDTGVGMSEETMQKLFRIDVTHTTRGTAQETGTGLGLILCKELVEKNGGTIWVESTPGKGSTFRFTVPQHQG